MHSYNPDAFIDSDVTVSMSNAHVKEALRGFGRAGRSAARSLGVQGAGSRGTQRNERID